MVKLYTERRYTEMRTDSPSSGKTEALIKAIRRANFDNKKGGPATLQVLPRRGLGFIEDETCPRRNFGR